MEKLNYCKKKCKCGGNLKISSMFNNGNYVVLRCNNQNCLKKYHMDKKRAIKCEYKINPKIIVR